jgi:3-oxoacyl-[acyl-carrier protein] reductase
MTDRNTELEGKVAIITGSARNIGRATAEELARAGAAVTVNAVQAAELCQEVADGIVADGGKAIPVIADITKQADAERIVETTVESFGGLDILILNAAVRIDRPFLERSFADHAAASAVNMDGCLRVALAAVPHMIRRGGGAIVGIHGSQSYIAAPGKAPAAKDAMAGMIRGMARDLGEYDITCNIAVVGQFDTEREGGSGTVDVPRVPPIDIPAGRRGVPQDMANLLRFLSGPYARYISGQTIQVGGGLYMPH